MPLAAESYYSSTGAVPFEEDAQNPKIWFVDHSYMENMFAMFRKVNGKQSFSRVLFDQKTFLPGLAISLTYTALIP